MYSQIIKDYICVHTHIYVYIYLYMYMLKNKSERMDRVRKRVSLILSGSPVPV